MLVPKGTHEVIVDNFLRARTRKPHVAGETTSICHATMNVCKGNVYEARAGSRIIRSIFRRNGISQYRTTLYLNRVKRGKKVEIANYLLTLKPYKETAEWLLTEAY